jgi:hypothetical protein
VNVFPVGYWPVVSLNGSTLRRYVKGHDGKPHVTHLAEIMEPLEYTMEEVMETFLNSPPYAFKADGHWKPTP